jgi:hypothetical protein
MADAVSVVELTVMIKSVVEGCESVRQRKVLLPLENHDISPTLHSMVEQICGPVLTEVI